ncbi:hypothetical protein HYH03_018400 [Edaphochlamys debaryana]|uniref:Uncharacterized protein n=1 Tax=Edaphochlamys debaryana TaxID=47281 RepID=A0A836BPF8_9CHLO|nr:hypothetical protein HYH03_018400 [Edaphochlamys debaryana]|eukprot:KAG2482694.1 hypothetical protein HYH03_018400 [Edaphochlamys debaryana]
MSRPATLGSTGGRTALAAAHALCLALLAAACVEPWGALFWLSAAADVGASLALACCLQRPGPLLAAELACTALAATAAAAEASLAAHPVPAGTASGGGDTAGHGAAGSDHPLCPGGGQTGVGCSALVPLPVPLLGWLTAIPAWRLAVRLLAVGGAWARQQRAARAAGPLRRPRAAGSERPAGPAGGPGGDYSNRGARPPGRAGGPGPSGGGEAGAALASSHQRRPHQSAIPWAEPDLISPGFELRLAEVLASGAVRLGGVWVQPGCVELTLLLLAVDRRRGGEREGEGGDPVRRRQPDTPLGEASPGLDAEEAAVEDVRAPQLCSLTPRTILIPPAGPARTGEEGAVVLTAVLRWPLPLAALPALTACVKYPGGRVAAARVSAFPPAAKGSHECVYRIALEEAPSKEGVALLELAWEDGLHAAPGLTLPLLCTTHRGVAAEVEALARVWAGEQPRGSAGPSGAAASAPPPCLDALLVDLGAWLAAEARAGAGTGEAGAGSDPVMQATEEAMSAFAAAAGCPAIALRLSVAPRLPSMELRVPTQALRRRWIQSVPAAALPLLLQALA